MPVESYNEFCEFELCFVIAALYLSVKYFRNLVIDGLDDVQCTQWYKPAFFVRLTGWFGLNTKMVAWTAALNGVA